LQKGKIMKVIIIGGVAAGPKAASKIIRMNPDADITIIEKGVLRNFLYDLDTAGRAGTRSSATARSISFQSLLGRRMTFLPCLCHSGKYIQP